MRAAELLIGICDWYEYAKTNEKYGGFSKETIEKYNIPNVAWSNQESNA